MGDLTRVEIEKFRKHFERLEAALGHEVKGQHEVVHIVAACFLVQGHILVEGNPGTAKTFMAQVLAKHTGMKLSRIQGTPDLMPGDIIGSPTVDSSGELKWRDGPLFQGNLIFVDEINRMNPRTQSITLQAMQEGEARILINSDDIPGSKPLCIPHMFIATMNPIEQEGTYPLPEAQLDRFAVKIIMPTPDRNTLKKILENFSDRHVTQTHLESLSAGEEYSTLINIDNSNSKVGSNNKAMDEMLGELREIVAKVETGEVLRKIIALIHYTTPVDREELLTLPLDTPQKYIQYGGSPRGAQTLLQMSRVQALYEGSEYLNDKHVEKVLIPVLRHRIQLKYQAIIDKNYTNESFLVELWEKISRGHLE